MFGAIGAALSAVGTSIISGLKYIWTDIIKPIGGLIKSGFDTVVKWGSDFIGNVGSAIKSGWDWVTNTVGEWFGGSSAATKSDAYMAVAGKGSLPSSAGYLNDAWDEAAINATREAVSSGMSSGVNVASTSALGAGTKGLIGANPISGNEGWSITPLGASKVAERSGIMGTFSNVVDFFSTDVGQMVGQGGMALLAKKMDNDLSRKQIQEMEKEARRQEAQKQQDWLVQEQRNNQLNQFTLDYQQKRTEANNQNRYAGLTGVWQRPDTTMPSPAGLM